MSTVTLQSELKDLLAVSMHNFTCAIFCLQEKRLQFHHMCLHQMPDNIQHHTNCSPS